MMTAQRCLAGPIIWWVLFGVGDQKSATDVGGLRLNCLFRRYGLLYTVYTKQRNIAVLQISPSPSQKAPLSPQSLAFEGADPLTLGWGSTNHFKVLLEPRNIHCPIVGKGVDTHSLTCQRTTPNSSITLSVHPVADTAVPLRNPQVETQEAP